MPPSQSFSDFRRSDLFRQVRDQFLDRVSQCERFAQTHFSPAEAAQVLEGFEVFKQRLLEGDGRYFGDSLPLLYGNGKRSLDTFCLRLEQPDLDLHQRKTALRELGSQLQACRSTGPAFTEAANALDQDVGGLRGEFLVVLKDLVDGLLLQFLRRNNSPAQEEWLGSMEVHVVNRIKLELGLPGADLNDHFSLGGDLLGPGRLRKCVVMLRHQLRPVTVASQLAQRHHDRLLDALSQSLGLPAHAVDPNEHLPAIRCEVERLGATFGRVSMHSLLDHDPASGHASWRADLTLVALDLMRELIRLNLVVPQQSGNLVTATEPDSQWQLRHVDFLLFHVEERIGPSVAEHSVGLRHFAQWHAGHASESVGRVRHGLTHTALSAESPEALMDFPPDWLDRCSHARHLLQRLGPVRSALWAARHAAMDPRVLAMVLRAATAAGHGALLEVLSERHAHRSAAMWVKLGGGPVVLADAVAHGDTAVVRHWQHRLRAALPDMTAGDLATAFTAIGGGELVSSALLTANPQVLDLLLSVLAEARQAGRISDQGLHQHLRAAMQEAMFRGRLDALQVFGHHLAAAARQGWVPEEVLQELLEGEGLGAGCNDALRGGQANCIRWFYQLVIELAAENLLERYQAEMMLTSAGSNNDPTDGAAEAIRQNHGEALGTFLDLAVEATAAGWIREARLVELLTCQWEDEQGLRVMLRQPDDHCLRRWLGAVVKANRANCLSTTAVASLVSAPGASGSPYVREIAAEAPPGSSLGPWLTTVATLVREGSLLQRQVPALLEARGSPWSSEHTPALHAALVRWPKPGAVARCVALYGEASKAGLIDASTLKRLLLAVNLGQSLAGALAVAILRLRHHAVHEYLQAIISLAKAKVLDANGLALLLDARGEGPRTALFVAITHPPAHSLRPLLAATLEATQAGLISGEQWLLLLLPEGGAANVLDALAAHFAPNRIEQVRNAIRVAHGCHLISPQVYRDLQMRLDFVALQVEGRLERMSLAQISRRMPEPEAEAEAPPPGAVGIT